VKNCEVSGLDFGFFDSLSMVFSVVVVVVVCCFLLVIILLLSICVLNDNLYKLVRSGYFQGIEI
jgi:hypothetical protein